jgi:serine phosphatase RsbU (regulator of sigma subunit)/Tfp pilus assembly protein PilF
MQVRIQYTYTRRLKSIAFLVITAISSLLLAPPAYADIPGIDSLKKVIQFSKYKIAKADAYVQLSELVYFSNIDSVVPLCALAIQILDSDKTDSSAQAKLRILNIKAHALNNIGSVFYSKGNLPKALDYYLKGLRMREELGDKMGLAESYNNLGVLYKRQGDTNKAISYYQQSLKFYVDANYLEGQANSLGNIGILYASENKNDTALSYLLKEYNIVKGTGNKHSTARVLGDIGTIYQKQNKFDDALKYCQESLDLATQTDDKDYEARTLYIIAQIEYDKNNYEKAHDYGTRALAISKDLGFPVNIMNAAKLMYQVYNGEKKWKEALDMHIIFSAMHDSVNSQEMRKQVIQKEIQNEYDKKETEMKAAEERRDLISQAESKRQRIAILLAAIIAISTGVIAILIFRSLKTTRRQKVIIEEQKVLVEQKNKDVLDSITYAKRLQDAILPPIGLIEQYFPESFILYKPKDIVAGDFYWMETPNKEGTIYIAAADCTGHGVPGAMVSVVCSNSLNRAVKEFNISEPGKILDKTRELVIETFEKSESDVNDGMDISLLAISYQLIANGLITAQWSGANNPLWYIHNGEFKEIIADKQPLGKYERISPFTTHTIELKKGDSIYLFTDGFADQFGGPKDKKFKDAQLRELIREIAGQSIKEQKNKLDVAFENWKENKSQTDDVCIIGIRV